MARSQTVRDILRVNKSFYKEHGFYPSLAWIGKEVGKTRERVRQIFSNYRDERLKRNEDRNFDTVHFTGEIQLHPIMMNEINIILSENDISFREALKSWSYNKYKDASND